MTFIQFTAGFKTFKEMLHHFYEFCVCCQENIPDPNLDLERFLALPREEVM